MPDRREVIKGAATLPLILGSTAILPDVAGAQSFPVRTMTIVVPFPPGGVADLAARLLATFLAKRFGKNVVVENRPGAGGGVGHTYFKRAEPDGHSIMVTISSLAVIPEGNRRQGRASTYEVTDFAPLARMFLEPALIWVKADARWRNIEELFDEIKRNPGKISYASSGLLGPAHLAMEMLLRAAGLQMLHIPYPGGAATTTALLSGQTDVAPSVLSNFKGLFDSNEVRPLLQIGEKRMSNFPDIPTAIELGYKDVIYTLWTGVFVPAKVSEDIQAILRASIRDFMSNPETLEAIRRTGTVDGYVDGDDFARFLEIDTARLLAVARAVDLK